MPPTIKIPIDLGERSYSIHIGADLLQQPDQWQLDMHRRRALIVTDTAIAPLYLERLQNTLNTLGCDHEALLLPGGEEQKNFDTLQIILNTLLDQRFARDGLIIALGGGVIGDISGFAAAIYQRGIDYLQIPTTLLAQVDSSIGGKTAINHPLGKNMIGAFHQPRGVVTDPLTLRTLPERELRAGLAEVIKYSLIYDAPFFEWLEANIGRLLHRDLSALVYAIERSCRLKAEIVSADEHERGHLRALLNLGHTFGHAIEAGLGYGIWLHGEAVAVGICAAARMSFLSGRLTSDSNARIAALVGHAGLPTTFPAELSPRRMLALMANDKKVKQGRVYLVLLNAIGRSENTADYDDRHLLRTLEGADKTA